MNTVVRIAPTQVDIGSAGDAQHAELIALGGVPRGAVLLASTSSDHDTAEVQNALAGHGFESLFLWARRSEGDADGYASVDLIQAGLQYLATRGWTVEQVGVVGYGRAGWAALDAAVAFELGAAVTVSPTTADLFGRTERDRVLHAAPRLRTPWLGLMAGSADCVSALDRSLMAISQPPEGSAYARVVSYPEVPQSFYDDSGDASAHAAGFDAWQRTIEWLNQRVVPRPTPLELLWRARHTASVDQPQSHTVRRRER